MKPFLRHVILFTLALACATGADALDLPVKKINGVNQYYYTVKSGDTVFGLSRRFGIPTDKIVEFNSSAADGLRAGETLYFPVSEFEDPANPTLSASSAPTFRYKVQRGETLFGLSHRFGVTPEDIVALNPQSNDGIKAGEYLIIPGTSEPEESLANAPVHAGTTSEPVANPRPAAPVAQEPSVTAQAPVAAAAPVAPASGDSEAVMSAVDEVTPGTVAVLLPLMLDEATPSKTAQRSADFVKGLMLASAQLGTSGQPVKISVHDTKGSPAEIARILSDPALADADVIVGPDDEASLAAIAAKASPDAYIFNILAVQDTTYRTHANILQANIPHHAMYEKAADAVIENFRGYTPVFLISKGGRAEKAEFTQYLRQRYAERSIMPVEISYEGLLQSADLETLSPEVQYVFIPASGSLSEFNKFSRALRTARENAARPEMIALFGYPDWTIFRNDAAEQLHQLEATFYTRFFANPNSAETAAFETAFKNAFGAEPMATVPSQAMLGYDTAQYIITNLRANSGVFSPQNPAEFEGLQSAFRFEGSEPAEENTPETDEPERGDSNSALYIVTYLPGNGVATRVL